MTFLREKKYFPHTIGLSTFYHITLVLNRIYTSNQQNFKCLVGVYIAIRVDELGRGLVLEGFSVLFSMK
jgi:hypothetical protein